MTKNKFAGVNIGFAGTGNDPFMCFPKRYWCLDR